MAQTEKTLLADSKATSADYIDNVDQVSSEHCPEVQYDHAGIRGILHSPYVFGAGLLASFGGFSFGYGTMLCPVRCD